MTDITSKKEFHIQCPHYAKNLKSCPSFKKIIFPDDMELLKTCCLSESYSVCEIHRELIEKAA
jgi:hypothetical protein